MNKNSQRILERMQALLRQHGVTVGEGLMLCGLSGGALAFFPPCEAARDFLPRQTNAEGGRGLGKAALAAALAYIRTFPCGRAKRCWLSYEPENAAARALYRSFGFRETGEMDGDEVIAVLPL